MARLIVRATVRAGNEPNLLVRHEISPSLCFPDAARNDLERAGPGLVPESGMSL
jgi:hypothetical protein